MRQFGFVDPCGGSAYPTKSLLGHQVVGGMVKSRGFTFMLKKHSCGVVNR